MCEHKNIVKGFLNLDYCDDCGICLEMSKVPGVTTAATVNMTVSDKLKYWGIKDARTGEGITKDTNVLDPIGITKKNKGKK